MGAHYFATMKPMLAKKFKDQRHKLKFPCYVQPKLNGVRMLFFDGCLQSRDSKEWKPGILPHIEEALQYFPSSMMLDGELYIHGESLQMINSRVSVNRVNSHQAATDVVYHVFDCLDFDWLECEFAQRSAFLCNALPSFPDCVQFVPTHEIQSHAEGDYWFNHYKEQGYEGLMYRQNVEYGLGHKCGNKENRWDVLLKRKDFLDEDCEIVDFEYGTGKYENCVGSLILRFPANNCIFNAGSGLSDAQRHRYVSNPPIGLTAKIKYEMLSDKGVPLKPTIECVNE
jgi:DNA ligase-1